MNIYTTQPAHGVVRQKTHCAEETVIHHRRRFLNYKCRCSRVNKSVFLTSQTAVCERVSFVSLESHMFHVQPKILAHFELNRHVQLLLSPLSQKQQKNK